MKKIAFDLSTFTPSFHGGKDQVTYSLLSEFQRHDKTYDMVLFCFEELVPFIRTINSQIKICTIAIPEVKLSFRKLNTLIKKIKIGLFEKKKCNELGIDLLVFTNKLSTFCRFSIPTIIIPHDIQIFLRKQGNYDLIIKLLIKRELSLRSKIISISDFDKNSICSVFPRFQNRVKRIYNPIVFGNYNADSLNGKYVTAINIEHPHKNALVLVDAFCEVAKDFEFEFVLVGQYPNDIKQLEERIKKCDMTDRVRFLGYINQEELNKVIQETRLFVNASSFEGFGMSAVEMMGCGIPTIVPDNTAQREVTLGLCSYYSPATDKDKLVQAIRKELKTPRDKTELLDISQTIRRKYSSETIANEYLKLFEEI